jgi:hypothetical protein
MQDYSAGSEILGLVLQGFERGVLLYPYGVINVSFVGSVGARQSSTSNPSSELLTTMGGARVVAMTDWLYTLSDWVLLLGAATLLAGATFVLPSLVRHLPHLAPGAENSEFALRMQPTLFNATALVLVFTLVGVEANFRKAEAVVATEASHINRLDRLLARYEDPSALQIRTRLRV